MYNIWQKNYEFAIQVKIPTELRTAPYTEWLTQNIGHENVHWAYCFVKAINDYIVYQFYFVSDEDMAMFKLAML
jgi:hypothetical protein